MVATTISPHFKMIKRKTNEILTFMKKFYGVSHEKDPKRRLDFLVLGEARVLFYLFYSNLIFNWGKI